MSGVQVRARRPTGGMLASRPRRTQRGACLGAGQPATRDYRPVLCRVVGTHRRPVVGEVQHRPARARRVQPVQVELPARSDLLDLVGGAQMVHEGEPGPIRTERLQACFELPAAGFVLGADGQPGGRLAGFDRGHGGRAALFGDQGQRDRTADAAVPGPAGEPAAGAFGFGQARPGVVDRAGQFADQDQIATFRGAPDFAGRCRTHAVSLVVCSGSFGLGLRWFGQGLGGAGTVASGAPHLGVEGVEPGRPRPRRLRCRQCGQPAPQGFESVRGQAVDPPSATQVVADQPGLAQQPQVTTDRGPRDGETSRDLAGAELALSETDQDLPAHRVADRLEHLHP